MEPMSQEYVTEVDEDEVKLNAEINSLLDGIDFQQSLSQEKSPTCIPSSFLKKMDLTVNNRITLTEMKTYLHLLCSHKKKRIKLQ